MNSYGEYIPKEIFDDSCSSQKRIMLKWIHVREICWNVSQSREVEDK